MSDKILTTDEVRELLHAMFILSRAARDMCVEGSLDDGRRFDALDNSLQSLKEATRYGRDIHWGVEIKQISEQVRVLRESVMIP